MLTVFNKQRSNSKDQIPTYISTLATYHVHLLYLSLLVMSFCFTYKCKKQIQLRRNSKYGCQWLLSRRYWISRSLTYCCICNEVTMVTPNSRSNSSFSSAMGDGCSARKLFIGRESVEVIIASL